MGTSAEDVVRLGLKGQLLPPKAHASAGSLSLDPYEHHAGSASELLIIQRLIHIMPTSCPGGAVIWDFRGILDAGLKLKMRAWLIAPRTPGGWSLTIPAAPLLGQVD